MSVELTWSTTEIAWNEIDFYWNEPWIIKQVEEVINRLGGGSGPRRKKRGEVSADEIFDELDHEVREEFIRLVCKVKGVTYSQEKDIKDINITVKDIKQTIIEVKKKIKVIVSNE